MGMRHYMFCLLLFLAAAGKSQSKPVPVLNFAGFLPKLHQNDDTLHILNFWATWCKPCVAELPYFEEALSKYNDQPVKITLVSLDFLHQLESKLLPFVKQHSLRSEVVLLHEPDANAWIERVDQQWTGSIPATLFYLNEHRSFYEGSFASFADILQIIDSFFQQINK